MPTYTISFYNDEANQEFLYEHYYDYDEITVKPENPTKETDDRYEYAFIDWYDDSGNLFTFGKAENKDKKLHAKYQAIPRKFTITWKDGDEVLYSSKFDYGEDAEYKDTLEPKEIARNSKRYKLFKGWNNSTSFVYKDLEVQALWEEPNIPEDENADTTTFTAADIYTIAQDRTIGGLANKFFIDVDKDYIPKENRIRVQLGFTPNFNNINSTYELLEPSYFNGEGRIEKEGMNLAQTDKS